MDETTPPLLSAGTLLRALIRTLLLVLILGVFLTLAWTRARFNPTDTPLFVAHQVERMGFPPDPPSRAPLPPEEEATDPDPVVNENDADAVTETGTDVDTPEEEASAEEELADAGEDTPAIDWKNTPITGPVPGAQVAVFLSRRTMGLVHAQEYIRVYYHVAYSRDVSAPKLKADDLHTPQGTYRILAHELDGSVMTLVLNYPNAADAQRALAAGVIDRATHDRIVAADRAGGVPPWNTPMGGSIRIRGEREVRGVTEGDLLIRRADMEELWMAVEKGTVVRILP